MRLDALVTESPSMAWAAKIADLRKSGRPIVSLGIGEPDFATPPHIVEAAYKAMKDGFTTYSAAPGLPELREAVAAKLSADNAIAASPDEIVITPGAKNALFLAAAALLEPGDAVVNLTPCYVSNQPILKLAEPSCGLTDVTLKGPDFSWDLDALSAAVTDKTRLLVINYPNNPTGRMLSEKESTFLLELLRRRPKLHLLSDEIYERLFLGAVAPFSPASAADIQERVVTVNGMSKAYAMTGWRVGYTHSSRVLAKRIVKIHQQLNTHAATFSQKAAVAALQGPQDHIREFRSRLKASKKVYEDFLRGHKSLKGSTPEGGFFGFVDISSSGLKSDAFCAGLVEETGVAVLPGVSFGPAFDDYCRISLAAPAADIKAALVDLAAFAVARRRR